MRQLAYLLPLVLVPTVIAQEYSQWPSFRGQYARGVADGYSTVATWNVETGENIAWKTEIPGLAHSSPVIWDDKIFLTTSLQEGEAELKVGLYGSVNSVDDDSEQDFQLICVSKSSGEILWTRSCWQGVPEFKRHPKGSFAASSPATDGKYVAAFFGNEGLYVYDMAGELVWKKTFGKLDSGWFVQTSAQWGFSSSPVIDDGRIYIQADVQENSFLAAYDVSNGEEIWKVERNDVPTWSTPTVDNRVERSQLIVNGWKHAGGYDLDTGEELWKLEGGGDIPVPTPIVDEGLIFLTSSHGRMSPILAISTAAFGEMGIDPEESEDLVWGIDRGGNYMQTPIVYGGMLFACRDTGVLSCFEAQTGERLYRQRLGSGASGFTASGIAADSKLYFPSEEGEVHVLQAGSEFKEIAVNELGETCMASPAASEGILFFRTRSHLIAIGGDQ